MRFVKKITNKLSGKRGSQFLLMPELVNFRGYTLCVDSLDIGLQSHDFNDLKYFTESAHFADSVIESQCPPVCA